MVITDLQRTAGLLVLAIIALLATPRDGAQWSAQPGETKRNAFGPLRGDKASVCRGACGLGCPAGCTEEVTCECVDSTQLRRVESFECGTQQGCREHDDCLDTCSQTGLASAECQTRCHDEAVESYGLEAGAS
jgi:hypothetical protein